MVSAGIMFNKTGKVCCLITAFNGESTIAETLAAIARQSLPPHQIVVIDNASTDNTVGIIHGLGLENLRVIRNATNLGVGKAFNTGLAFASENKYEKLWIIDQDTFCETRCLENLLRAGSDLENQDNDLAALFPLARSKPCPEIILAPYFWRKTGFENAVMPKNTAILQVDSSITSGTLYSVDALQKVDGFREDYFIDCVDHECHMRLIKKGYRNFWVTNAQVLHELGRPEKDGYGEIMFVHPSWRHYYMCRNMTACYWKLGGLKAVLSFWREALRLMKRLESIKGQVESSRGFFLKGILDAMRGKFGPLEKS